MPIKITREEYNKKFGIQPQAQPVVQPKMPLLTSQSTSFGSNLGTGLKDVAVGAGKSFLEGSRGVAQAFQGIGKATLGAFGADTSQMGFKSLDNSTPEGAAVTDVLKSKSRGEQVGKVLGTAADVGVGFVKSGAQAALKARGVEKLTQRAEKVKDVFNDLEPEVSLPITKANVKYAEQAQKHLDFAADLVSPKQTTELTQQAIKQGRTTESGFLKKSKILPSKQDMDIAQVVKPYVSPKLSAKQNLKSLDDVVRSSNNSIKNYVETNKVLFNNNQLRSKLNEGKEELKLIFASDTNAENTYNAVADEFMKHVSAGDTKGLLDARQTFDKIPAVKKLLDSQGIGENVKREVVLTVREMANRYITELLPPGNPYRDILQKETKIIRAIENIAEKNAGNIGKNNLQILARRYPILKWLIGGVATGVAGGAGVGVGSAIIGSTDH